MGGLILFVNQDYYKAIAIRTVALVHGWASGANAKEDRPERKSGISGHLTEDKRRDAVWEWCPFGEILLGQLDNSMGENTQLDPLSTSHQSYKTQFQADCISKHENNKLLRKILQNILIA